MGSPGQFLARAVARQPGIDGPEWKRAWENIEKWVLTETEDDKRKAAKLLGELRAWSDVARFENTMPAIDAKGITDRVRTWANTMAGAERDPLLMCVVGAAKALSEALTKLDETPVSRRQIEQMIDSAIAEGLGNPAHRPQASISVPSAIREPSAARSGGSSGGTSRVMNPPPRPSRGIGPNSKPLSRPDAARRSRRMRPGA